MVRNTECSEVLSLCESSLAPFIHGIYSAIILGLSRLSLKKQKNRNKAARYSATCSC